MGIVSCHMGHGLGSDSNEVCAYQSEKKFERNLNREIETHKDTLEVLTISHL